MGWVRRLSKSLTFLIGVIFITTLFIVKSEAFEGKTQKNLATALDVFFLEEARSILNLGWSNIWSNHIESVRCTGDHPLYTPKRFSGNPFQSDCKEDIINRLGKNLFLPFGYNWVLSLGVGQFIPEAQVETFFDNLVKHSFTGLIISWTDGLKDHLSLNTQSQESIERQLKERGFERDREVEKFLKESTVNHEIREALMVFRRVSPRTFFLTFYRSGTNWLVYSMKNIMLRPVIGPDREFFDQPTFLEVKRADPIYHSHSRGGLEYFFKPIKSRDKLIFLLRGYVESFSRHFSNSKNIWSNLSNPHSSIHHYFENIRTFDSWDPEKRLLIYYEDLVNDFENTIKRLLDFLGEEDHFLEEFINNFEQHRQCSLEYYSRPKFAGGPKSRGENIHYHAQSFPPAELVALDHYVETHFPHLWDCYLSHYSNRF